MSSTLDRFFDHYFRRRPVNATFTGVHAYDAQLPDWSRTGLSAVDVEMRFLHGELTATHPQPASIRGFREDTDLLDAELARAFLEIQLAENASLHGVRGNPALWTGEAAFSVVSLMIRDFAPLEQRIASAIARLAAIPAFLGDAPDVLGDHAIPSSWTTRALRDCEGAAILLTRGVGTWLQSTERVSQSQAMALRAAAETARDHFKDFAQWLRARPVAAEHAAPCGAALYDLLLQRGHQCRRSRADLLAEANEALLREKKRFAGMLDATMHSWSEVQEQLGADHPASGEYLDAFTRSWDKWRAHAAAADVVTWPDWPIRYVSLPEPTREAAPYLYYLYYRSPAPLDRSTSHDYVVPPLPAADVERHLRAWNHSVISLNHVVHHGGLGHHVQNWHAYHRAASRVGKIAAVDCANRIGMFSAGSMAEGWACYATELMDELGFLSPLERVAQQHARLRFLARAIVDIEFHQTSFGTEAAEQFFVEQAHMDADAARAEVAKCSMFPGTAVMYWLGTQGILDLRAQLRGTWGSTFSLKRFHDELLGFGSLPVPLIARLMTEDLA